MISNSNSQFLPPVQENDFLPPISRWTILGGLVMVSVLGVAVLLASVTKYRVTVKAQAVVRPAGELRIVQAATEGQVMNISVKENQSVKKGDRIATIDDSRLQTKKNQLKNNIQQSQLQIAQIDAQILALNNQIAAETDRNQRAVASAEAELSRRQRDYQDRKITSKAEVEEAQANLKQAQAELQRAQVQLKSTQADLRSTDFALKAAQSKRNRYQRVANSGAISKNQLEEAQLNVDQQKQAVEMQKAAVLAQQQAIEQQKQAVEAARAKWQRAQTALNPSQAEVAIAQQGIAQEKAKGSATLATLEKERQALIQQQIEIKKQRERDDRELQQLELDLNQSTITATADGTISKLNLRNPGQTVRSGEEIAQIVPSDVPLVIKAAVPPQDKSKLKPGQKVQMRVSACAYTDYGTLKGVVSEISEDTIKPQANSATATAPATASSQQGGAVGTFYEVKIKPDVLFIGKGKNQCPIQVGMEGRADIISKEETVLQFLLRKAKLLAEF
ncbi:MAG TPA: HlyD family secretion protein [Cyanobacteria bacterium UBA11369]|nr:HlyD family secretion protein [Cyanobacteria bacterium UBA11371]HBE31149.1 HlyD family secretion protein [Cyanobacteria bacterium UBA11368]HBE50660.1 HlyD family secretion protein [Cyanobacteria bacterium UBA11369]